MAAELGYQDNVLIPSDRLASVIQLDVPAGRWVVSATVSLGNQGASPHDVDVWIGAGTPVGSFAGPRSGHVTVGPGEVATVTLGPFVAVAAAGGSTAVVVAQRDATFPTDQVYALGDTGVMTRAGATGMLALGAAG